MNSQPLKHVQQWQTVKLMKVSEATLKALRLLSTGGDWTAGSFAVAMGYGNSQRVFHMKGPTGAAVLKRLQTRGLVEVWDDWFGGTYVTTARLTDQGRAVLKEADSPQ